MQTHPQVIAIDEACERNASSSNAEPCIGNDCAPANAKGNDSASALRD
jgi:hypothetical protein